jgi:hypothetical protein
MMAATAWDHMQSYLARADAETFRAYQYSSCGTLALKSRKVIEKRMR